METDSLKSESARPAWSTTKIWLAAAALVATGLVVLNFDTALANPSNLEYLPGDLKRFVRLSELFAHGFGVGVVAIGIWLMAKEKRRFIPRIMLCAFWPSAGVHLMKICFARYRPIKYFDEFRVANFPDRISETWAGWMPSDQLNVAYSMQSFPSAHVATVWGLAIGMNYVFPQGRWLYVFLAILASIQRVSSFAHWSSDVFFGAAIACVMAGALTQNWGLGRLLGWFENRNQTVPPLQLAEVGESGQDLGRSKAA